MLQPPIEPMLAKLSPSIPPGPGFLYEPKWDGFRAIIFVSAGEAYLQSRDLKPLGRYFPELEEAIPRLLAGPAVLDGEIVIMGASGLEFDTLQMRLHPAASRVKKLAAETPASFVAFALQVVEGHFADEFGAQPHPAQVLARAPAAWRAGRAPAAESLAAVFAHVRREEAHEVPLLLRGEA